MRPNIKLLKDLGVPIPHGATSYHTDGNKIVFSVNIWPEDEKHFQGNHRFVAVDVTDEQRLELPPAASGPGVMLEVADAHGYRGD